MAYEWIQETVCNVSAVPPEGLCYTSEPTTSAPSAAPTYMPSYMPSRNPTQRPTTPEPSFSPSTHPSFLSTTEIPTKNNKPPPPKKGTLKSPDERTFDVDSAIDSNLSTRRSCIFAMIGTVAFGAALGYYF